jgi:hypothetical protein
MATSSVSFAAHPTALAAHRKFRDGTNGPLDDLSREVQVKACAMRRQ